MTKVTLKSKNILLFSSVIILPFMFMIFSITTSTLGTEKGYFLGFIIYWSFCLSIIYISIKTSATQLKSLYTFKLNSKNALLYSSFSLLPAFGLFSISFLPNIHLLDARLITLVLITSIINGFVEELYWRGLFLIEFKKNVMVGLLGSTLLFTSWHIALYSIDEINYGGFLALVGGSTLLGLLWSFCTRKLNSILFPTMGHILVNIFAFTELYTKNTF